MRQSGWNIRHKCPVEAVYETKRMEYWKKCLIEESSPNYCVKFNTNVFNYCLVVNLGHMN